ncbi:MAG: inositol monophosphatase family protein [Rickettsia hoogstraalii]
MTKIDKTIERALVKLISNVFPHDGILGEEITHKSSKSGYLWTIDPIDGTIAYVHDLPLFSTLIGLVFNGRIVLGVASFPALSKVFFAVANHGSYCVTDSLTIKTHVKLFSTRQPKLGELVFCHSGENYFQKESDKYLFNKIKSFSKYVRSWGDAYGHIMVAKSSSDIMVDTVLKVWDIVPLKIILEESGNVFFTKPQLNLENRFQNYLAVSCASKKFIMRLVSEFKE